MKFFFMNRFFIFNGFLGEFACGRYLLN